MRVETTIALPEELLEVVDQRSLGYGGRSRLIETAIRTFVGILRPETVPSELRARFQALAVEWLDATRYVSSLTDMVTHPAYQRIIGMGMPVVPLLLEQLDKEPQHWFWALKAITGEEPVADSDRGYLEKMTRAWRLWGREHGYC